MSQFSMLDKKDKVAGTIAAGTLIFTMALGAGLSIWPLAVASALGIGVIFGFTLRKPAKVAS